MKKVCRDCGHEGEASEDFYAHPRMKDGYLNKCKDCVKGRIRKQREDDPLVQMRDRVRYRLGKREEARKRYMETKGNERRKLRYRANAAVSYAVQAGKLVRPNTCEECGQQRYCEAAHHDYSKPLDVRWLCRRCHRRWDSAQSKSRAS